MRDTFAWREHRFEVDWPDDAVREIGCVALSYHGAAPSSASSPADWRFSLSVETPDASGVEHMREIARHTSGLQILGDDGQIVLWNGRSLGRIDPQRGAITVHLAPARRKLSTGLDVDVFLMLTFGVLSMLQSRGLFVLHAAGVVSPEDLGIVLVAPSDSGKSTITTSLARAGWDYISDDSIILESMDGIVVVSPFRRDFGLDPEADELFPGIATSAQTQLTDAAKWCIDPTQAFRGTRRERVTPSVLVVPSIVDRDESRLRDLAPTDALIELLRQSSFLTFDRDATAQYMAILKEMVSSCRAFRLEAGRDLRDDPALIAPLLRGAIQEAAQPDARAR